MDVGETLDALSSLRAFYKPHDPRGPFPRLGKRGQRSQSEHVQKRPFRNELRTSRRKAPGCWHGPPLASTRADLGGLRAFVVVDGRLQGQEVLSR